MVDLFSSFSLSPEQGTHALPVFSLVGTPLAVDPDSDDDDICNEVDGGGGGAGSRACATADRRFRSQDGSCNNLRRSNWGRANVALQRLLSPKYEDGEIGCAFICHVFNFITRNGSFGKDAFLIFSSVLTKMICSVLLPSHLSWPPAPHAYNMLSSPLPPPSGISSPRGFPSSLPSARSLSSALISDRDNPSREHTLMLMQWGQFLDHDVTHTPLSKGEDGDDILCCSPGGVGALNGELRHPECHPVEIPASDPVYGRLGQTCMEFVRSMPARNPECRLGAREQVNQITGFVDASNVYGSDPGEARLLRLGRGGRLRVTKFREEELLPLDPEECADHDRRQYCFVAGEGRNINILYYVPEKNIAPENGSIPNMRVF